MPISPKKWCFQSKGERENITILIFHIRIGLATTFQLKLKIFFWTKFTKKDYSWSKTKNVNTIIEFCPLELVYSHVNNVLRLLMIDQVFPSSQMKRSGIISNKHDIYELSHELRLRKLGS